ncbi:PLDc N-terminal domain-containing protein [Aquiflexum sp. TKW24L]|uniref:PLDc N-terminal domain-containing protein n=1 Tax=Aquiflexum sp. TKW24L TaxID=2942212 RepID=UPI0020C056C1|nr:PLDc N-terminal domain-containing protein [Aquiflexum sp. TKW24L]MCL6260525.1 PLDc N-terminal domain-containing protein [Aquiflexum sp. TKW24L]
MFGLGFLGLAIYIYTIYDVVSSKFGGNNDKLVWLLIVIFLPLIGSILWFLMVRNRVRR